MLLLRVKLLLWMSGRRDNHGRACNTTAAAAARLNRSKAAGRGVMLTRSMELTAARPMFVVRVRRRRGYLNGLTHRRQCARKWWRVFCMSPYTCTNGQQTHIHTHFILRDRTRTHTRRSETGGKKRGWDNHNWFLTQNRAFTRRRPMKYHTYQFEFRPYCATCPRPGWYPIRYGCYCQRCASNTVDWWRSPACCRSCCLHRQSLATEEERYRLKSVQSLGENPRIHAPLPLWLRCRSDTLSWLG